MIGLQILFMRKFFLIHLFYAAFFTLFILLTIPVPLWSQQLGLNIFPDRLYLDPHKKIGTLEIINQGDKKVTFQLSASRWQQSQKTKDTYQSTEEILFFPKIFPLGADEKRIIRVGYQGPDSLSQEKAYRLFIQHLNPEKNFQGLTMAMRIGVPVFYSPMNKSHEAKFQRVEISKGKVNIDIENQGNNHFMIRSLTAVGIDGAGNQVFTKEGKAWYVLPGITKSFPIEIAEEDCIQADTIKVIAETRNFSLGSKQTLTKEIEVNDSKCR